MADSTKKKTANNLIGAQTKAVPNKVKPKIGVDTDKVLIDNIIGTGLNGGLDISTLESFTGASTNRDQMYQLIDTMAADSTVSSVLRTYAEDVCETADNGHVIWCEASDPKISKFVNYLLNVMNIDKNMYSWAYSLLKYGDLYIRLFRESDYQDDLFNTDAIARKERLHESVDAAAQKKYLNDQIKQKIEENVQLNIHTANDPYSFYVEANSDPGAMFELTKFGQSVGYIEVPVNQIDGLGYLDQYLVSNTSAVQNYRMRSSQVTVYQADDFVHACLDDNNNRYPEKVDIFIDPEGKRSTSYNVKRGKSILIDSYKVWREKSLLENAALLNRVTRSSIVRTIEVEVGDMPKEQVSNTLRRVKELIEQKTAIDANGNPTMSEYTNPGPVENNIYLATHEGKGGITINSLGGDVDVKNLADLDWWNNKFYASYGIPKQYFGWTDDGAGFNGGSSLTILSSVYAKGVKRVQNALIQAITDIVNLYCLNKGCPSYVNNFTLKMKAPLTQEEIDYRNDLTNRISAVSNLQSLFGDVEDKGRKLTILKDLVATLNYGDSIIEQIQLEIDDFEKQKQEEAEKAKQEQEQLIASEETSPEQSSEETVLSKIDLPDDTDLGTAGVAMESLDTDSKTEALLESQNSLVEDDLDLPTAESLNLDLTKNN